MSWNIRRNPFYPNQVERHDGIDLPYGMNEMISAKQDGVITRISNDPNGYGNFVDILHDDGTTGRYAHAGIISRGEGQRVKRGDEIGLAGSTGRSTGPHLHFEHLDQSGRPMDPRPFLASVGGRAPTQFATGPQAAPTQNYGGPNMNTVLPQATGAYNPEDPMSVYDFIRKNQTNVPVQQLSPEQQQMLMGDRQQRAAMLPLAMGASLSGDRGVSEMGKLMYADSMAARGPQKLGDQGWLTADGKLIKNPFAEEQSEQGRQDRALNLSISTANTQLQRRLANENSFSLAVFTPEGKPIVTNRTGQNYVVSQTPNGVSYAPHSGPVVPKSTWDKNVQEAQTLLGSADQADQILAMVDQHPEAFGLVAAGVSKLPEFAQGRIAAKVLSPETMKIRTDVLRAAAQEISTLYGAALSMGEQSRANTFIPNSSDDPEVIIAKLKSARDWAKSKSSVYGPGVNEQARSRMGGPQQPRPPVTSIPGSTSSTEPLSEEEQRELEQLRTWQRGGQR